jgi:hypothetical protein
MTFDELSEASAQRLCEHLVARAEPLDPALEVWHYERNEPVSLVALGDVMALARQEKVGPFAVALRRIWSGGVRLPAIDRYLGAISRRPGRDPS